MKDLSGFMKNFPNLSQKMDLKLNFDMNMGYVTHDRPIIPAGVVDR